MPNFIKITLPNGEERHLHASESVGSGMVADEMKRAATQDGGWTRTVENTLVRVEHVVEAVLVLDGEHPKQLAEHV